jgi:4-hydroxybenzoate polyprenyltransferase
MNWRTGLVLAAFLVLNSIYSLWAKNIAMIDVLFISGSFVLRVMGGATAISVPISIWILSCTFALACYLGLGKRVHELRTIGADASTVRKALGGYQLGPAQVGLVVAGLASTLLYGAYSLSAHAVENLHTSSLIWTVPFAALGLARFGWITMRSRSDRSPTETLVTDPLVLLSVAAWSILSVGVVYWGWL